MTIEKKEDRQLRISLLTGGMDPQYALPLLSALTSRGVMVDFIGNDEMQSGNIVRNGRVNYLNLRGDQNGSAGTREKVFRIIKYYLKLIKYARGTESNLFHILWFNKFMLFDRILLNLYYKKLRKKLVFTAHNINAGERDCNDSFLNRVSLRFLYKIVEHIFVHTERMKCQLMNEFGISEKKITVIPFGINNSIPSTGMSKAEARRRLGINIEEKVILFFGLLAPYKGVDQLVMAFGQLRKRISRVKLIIAGQINKGCGKYWEGIQRLMKSNGLEKYIIKRIEFIPDEEVEIYYKGADLLILPYRKVFQSGVLFTSFYFGLPVIGSDVGSLREDIIDGETGYICRPGDAGDLAEKMYLYFQSDLYSNLEENRRRIKERACEKHSWDIVGEKTIAVYKSLMGK